MTGGKRMKELIPADKYGVFADTRDTARVNSLYVAQFFEKEHFHVLRDIAKITDTNSGLSKEFATANFEPACYKDSTGRKLPCYMMTRDGFTMLVMGYIKTVYPGGVPGIGKDAVFIRRN